MVHTQQAVAVAFFDVGTSGSVTKSYGDRIAAGGRRVGVLAEDSFRDLADLTAAKWNGGCNV